MIALALAFTAAALAPVELRGGDVLAEPVVEVSLEGVLVGGEAPRLIGWDRAKRVTGERAPEAETYRAIADDAWRARMRVARGDFALAEPLLEGLFDDYQDSSGPTSLFVAEGLMRCRLARGDARGAIEPWLMALRLRRDGQRLVGEPPIPPLIDEETGLVPTLAPIFDLVAGSGTSEVSGAGGGDDTAVLARWYEAAAGGAPAPTFDSAAAPEGVALVGNIVLAQGADGEQRRAARAWLASQLNTGGDSDGWREAWLRAAIGLSLLKESARDDVDRGLLHLAHLPARFGSGQPHLTGVALAAMIRTVRARGDSAQASALADDLRAIDHNHPALRPARSAPSEGN